MNHIEQLIGNYEKAGEELAGGMAVAAISGKMKPSVEEGRELMDRISFAERLGARAERSVLEMVALSTAIEVIKRKIAEQVENR